MKRGKLKAVSGKSRFVQPLPKVQSMDASIGTKAGHPFYVMKNLFRYKQIAYRRLVRIPASCKEVGCHAVGCASVVN
jgi:hypothetical protein